MRTLLFTTFVEFNYFTIAVKQITLIISYINIVPFLPSTSRELFCLFAKFHSKKTTLKDENSLTIKLSKSGGKNTNLNS